MNCGSTSAQDATFVGLRHAIEVKILLSSQMLQWSLTGFSIYKQPQQQVLACMRAGGDLISLGA
jgi:hypothetical protein